MNDTPPTPAPRTPMPPEALATATLLTIEQAAEILHVCKNSVFNLLSRGELKRVKVGRRSLVRQADLERFIAGGGSQ